MSSQTNDTTLDTPRQPAELRAEAERMEAAAAAKNKGKAFILHFGGLLIHDGEANHERMLELIAHREASDAEVHALRSIPEFAAHLDRVRGA